MGYRVFRWCPRIDAVQEVEPLLNIIQFGDGIEQRQLKGLRLHRNKFPDLKFVAKKEEINEITDFLLLHITKPFWFSFQGKQYLVRKDGPYKLVHKSKDICELTVSFVEVMK
ncbi:phage tail protein [Wohlfahrtiimonas chitiniclastica]|uniref:phage tail protein n=1 Tax=Wohlfahrtiimonas chitiniclastica TaxID=400946 RepID=UPI000B99753D|nr:phage tail protein [Wohlfahrtiimonas chitiniclastica]MBS7815933.1 phage tail protein [Wohlfahrtiimonas chitiniclastica]MBS7822072.1 phage tail protein [Wohlfahrtiimonas chitiniclastica]MBS7829864.1 phage tail protein [Wohlfahrtiimonas chitiniclastica]MBS7831831.1 phage tail protein [Wohlfahrtiimonas chitiniclastica]MDC7252345.1 hypothetical protein [Wohlfahrtiimonas chitiniclastica]